MKKLNFRLVIFTVLAVTSIVSYSYLNRMSTEVSNPVPIYSPVNEEISEPEITLPDVELIKKVIEAGKKLSAFSH